MASEGALLEMKDLRVHFRTYRGLLKVLDGVNLAVHCGERVGLVGETGCGKTTALKAAMRILPREAIVAGGEVTFKGRNIFRLRAREMREVRTSGISMVFQDPTAALNPVFSIGEFMRDVIRFSSEGNSSGEDPSSRAIAALRDVALPDPSRMLETYPFQLSGGMRQRVCIGVAISSNRELLLADEPGTSLDVTIQDQVLRLLNLLVEKKGLSVLLVSHSLGVVREMTDRVNVMYAGSIIEEASSSEMFTKPCHPYTKALLECVPKLSGEGISRGIPGSMVDYLNPPQGCRFRPRCPKAIAECDTHRPVMRRVSNDHSVACFLYK